MHRLFQSKANRDAAWKADGKRGYRSSIRGQCLHPQYVEDFVGSAKDDTGFGNNVYKTLFPVLYILDRGGFFG